MPYSITKNVISISTIEKMVKAAFPDTEIIKCEELTEGFFNVAYNLELSNKSEVILKIAPTKAMNVMTHEKNIMFSEVDSMRNITETLDVPIADILFYDNSHSICECDYFFMAKLKGKSFSSCMGNLTDDEKQNCFLQIGKYNAKINSIHGKRFGYYGQPDKQGEKWFDVFVSMIEDTYNDASRKNIEIPVPLERILSLLEMDRKIFEQVKIPKLVHWDIWAGNVFIHEGSVTGIIDFERCLWGDELLEVGFRTYGYEKAFFDGYGITRLTKDQLVRAQWYDIYLFLICCLECDYRQYNNRNTYNWGTKMLLDWVEKKANITYNNVIEH